MIATITTNRFNNTAVLPGQLMVIGYGGGDVLMMGVRIIIVFGARVIRFVMECCTVPYDLPSSSLHENYDINNRSNASADLNNK